MVGKSVSDGFMTIPTILDSLNLVLINLDNMLNVFYLRNLLINYCIYVRAMEIVSCHYISYCVWLTQTDSGNWFLGNLNAMKNLYENLFNVLVSCVEVRKPMTGSNNYS